MNKSGLINESSWSLFFQRSLYSIESFLGTFLDSLSSVNGRFNLRRIQRKDNDTIKELIQKILIQRGGVGTDSLFYDPELIDICDSYYQSDSYFAVLTYRKEVVGGVGLKPAEGEMDPPSDICELKKLYLHKDFRNKGQGKYMFDFAMKKAKKLGYKSIKVVTERRNENFLEFLLRENFELRECNLSSEDETKLVFYKKLKDQLG